MKKMFVRTFLLTYRLSHAFDDLTDIEIEDSLSTYFQEFICSKLQNNNSQLGIFAKQDEKLVGFALFEKITQEEMYVREHAIDPDYWQEGVGKKLTLSILDKEPTCKKIFLLTERVNKRAQAFYESIGFQPSCYTHEGYSSKKFLAYEIEWPLAMHR